MRRCSTRRETGAGGKDGSLRMLGAVEAGFPSPAEEDQHADSVSLDELLVQNPETSFLLKVSGDSMSGAGIIPGDMIIVDKSLEPANGDVVVAEVDGAWTLKRLKKRGDSASLQAENAKYPLIVPKRELKIAGVVIGVVRKYSGPTARAGTRRKSYQESKSV